MDKELELNFVTDEDDENYNPFSIFTEENKGSNFEATEEEEKAEEIISNYKTIKLPTHKELGFNIRDVLRIEKPESFKLLLNKWGEAMRFALNRWCEYNNCVENKERIWHIIYYLSFINYKREERCKRLLISYGFTEVESTNMWEDGILKIDIKAKSKNNQLIYIQVKPRYQSKYFNLYGKLKTFCINKNAVPVLAVEFKNESGIPYFVFYNLLNNQKTPLKDF